MGIKKNKDAVSLLMRRAKGGWLPHCFVLKVEKHFHKVLPQPHCKIKRFKFTTRFHLTFEFLPGTKFWLRSLATGTGARAMTRIFPLRCRQLAAVATADSQG